MPKKLPGAVVRIIPDVAQVSVPAFPRFLAIVAPGEYKLQRDAESVIRSTTGNQDILSKTPVLEIISVGDRPGGSDYIEGTDFILTSADGNPPYDRIEWIPETPASVVSDNPETYDFSGGADTFRISVDYLPFVTIDLSGLGATATAADVANAINTALSTEYGADYSAVASVEVVGGVNYVKLTSVKTGRKEGAVILEDVNGALGVLGFTAGVYKGEKLNPEPGDTYYVTYVYEAGDETYQPTLYYDGNKVFEEHGGVYLSNGQINPIGLMAKIAFNRLPESIPGLLVVQLDLRNAADPYNPTDSELLIAYRDAIQKLEQVDIGKLYIVPATTDETILDEFVTHVIGMSAPEVKQERMLLMTLPSSKTVEDFVAKANQLFSERVMLFYPPEVTVDEVGQKLPGYYAAVVYGARKTAVPVGTPINDEPLVGITVDTKVSYNELRRLVFNGVAVVVNQSGVTKIVHGVTTRTDYVVFEEENVVDIADYIKFIWRTRLFEAFKNTPITETTLNSVVSASVRILEELKRDNIITGYKDLSATQDPNEPRQINVRGRVRPQFHTLYMDIEFVFTI